MDRTPKIVFLISGLMLFNLFLWVGFDLTRLQLVFQSPYALASIVLPITTSIGLVYRQVWAWYLTAILTALKIVRIFIALIFNSDYTSYFSVYSLCFLIQPPLILWILFHDDVTEFFKFTKDSKEKRIKQIITYTVTIVLIMIPLLWLAIVLTKH